MVLLINNWVMREQVYTCTFVIHVIRAMWVVSTCTCISRINVQCHLHLSGNLYLCVVTSLLKLLSLQLWLGYMCLSMPCTEGQVYICRSIMVTAIVLLFSRSCKHYLKLFSSVDLQHQLQLHTNDCVTAATPWLGLLYHWIKQPSTFWNTSIHHCKCHTHHYKGSQGLTKKFLLGGECMYSTNMYYYNVLFQWHALCTVHVTFSRWGRSQSFPLSVSNPGSTGACWHILWK